MRMRRKRRQYCRTLAPKYLQLQNSNQTRMWVLALALALNPPLLGHCCRTKRLELSWTMGLSRKRKLVLR